MDNRSRSVYIIEDFNLRMGSVTCDTITNCRSQLWYTIEELRVR